MALPALIRRIAPLAGMTLLILALMAVGLRLAAGNSPGRWLAHSQLDGRDLPGLGRVSVSGLSGDPLARLHINTLTLHDDEGIWLTAEDITLDWQARSLISRPIRINELTVAQVSVDRRPVLAPSESDTPSGAGADIPTLPAIDLGALTLSRLILVEGLAGPATELSLHVSARLRPETSRITLDANRLDAPGDRLGAEFMLSADQVSGTLSATGEADGTLAALLRMSGRPVRLDGHVEGDADAGRGSIELLADDEIWAQADLAWDTAGWTTNSQVQLANWGLVPDPLAAEIETVTAMTSGRRADSLTIDTVTLESRGSRVTLREVTAPEILASYTISPAALERVTAGQVTADSLTGQAVIHRGEAPGIVLTPELQGLAFDPLGAEQLSGRVEISLPGGNPQLDIDIEIAGLTTGQADADRLLGETLRINGRLLDRGRETGWQAQPGFSLSAPFLTLTADGQLPPGESWPIGAAQIAVTETRQLHDMLAGPAAARLTFTANRRLTAEIDAGAITWPDSAQGLLDGLQAEFDLSGDEDGWTVSRFNARSPAIDLTLTGDARDAQDWQVGGDLALVGALPVSATEIEGGLATAFRLVRDPEALRIRAVTTARRLQAGPLDLRAPRLGVRGQLGERSEPTRLEWVFSAEDQAGTALTMNGQVEAMAERLALTLASGQFGDARFDGSAGIENDDLVVTLNAVRDELMALNASYAGRMDDLLAGRVDAELTLESQRLGAADLNAASLTLSGPLSGMALAASADGRMRSNVDLSATGTAAVDANGLSISLSPSGKWAAHNWTTLEPIRFATGADGVIAFASFTLGGGRLDLDLQTAGINPIASLTIDSLPVSVLSDIAAMPATQGMLSGAADLRQRDGVWRGSAQLVASDLLAGDLPDMPAMNMVLTASLQDEASASLRLTGGGLEAGGDLNRAGPTLNIARPQGEADAPLSGQITANGELIALAALFLPSDILMESGRIDSDFVVSGTVGEPRLNGTASLRDGQINATTAGSLITAVELDLILTENSAELTRFSASDNREGRLSGSGRLVLDTQGEARGDGLFTFDRFVAVRRPELTLQASGDLTLTLDEAGLLVSGESRIDQLRTQPTLNGAGSIPQLHVVEINLPKDRRVASETRLPIRLDYRVRAENGLYVSSRAFSSEWGVDLHVTGPESKPSLNGTANLVGGTAFVFNRRFSLASGVVTFDGAPSDARVDLTAVHSRTGFRASAQVEGSVQAPTITLSSDPALPEDEILARLLFDQSVSELGAFKAAQLAAQLSGQNLLDIVGQLRDLAGIDRLDISTNEDGNLSVVGGRRFGDNVYVEVGSNGAAAINEALIEWSLTADLSVLSRVSADTDASVAIRWRRDY
ncbi:translocation/assembly module TamB domain-containing protein [Maricaulis sp.]|uniref:translocation/assembly module TamB domain-containing protein n=1 Tax=Maricaulis sp. TaxID=1486257 RepID=UPI00262CAEBE|nr:translocation/assembly module TamB domain-containing protein [Maricaulis sp.]MDF1767988.1 translocation/assembly module TamB domain-containing protein [Maricaulis sp.]